ncbi:unnamed protein product [Diamesa serratosioi]
MENFGLKPVVWIYLLIIVFNCVDLSLSSIRSENEKNQHENNEITTTNPSHFNTNPKWYESYFDPVIPTNVTALVGKSAYLSCRVKNLGNKTVSWIRHRDLHILTVGTYTYTTDQRFTTTHHKEADEWTLQIKFAQKRDDGVYECQISTQPIKSYSVRLNLVGDIRSENEKNQHENNEITTTNPSHFNTNPKWYESYFDPVIPTNVTALVGKSAYLISPTATILGGPDFYVQKGSTINLTCSIRLGPEESQIFIFWYHKEEVLNSEFDGISIVTRKGEITSSHLMIQDAQDAHSGVYTCSPTNAIVGKIRVHVLNGEHPEAMYSSCYLAKHSLHRFSLLCQLYIFMYFVLTK